MILTSMYEIFIHMLPEEQDKFMGAYRMKRDTDLSDIPVAVGAKANGFSDEEKEVMKKLGLSVRDLKILKDAFA
jgi:hypothetical protein